MKVEAAPVVVTTEAPRGRGGGEGGGGTVRVVAAVPAVARVAAARVDCSNWPGIGVRAESRASQGNETA